MESTETTLVDRPAWTPLSLEPIGSVEQYANVCEYLKTIKAFQKRVTEFFAPHKARAQELHRALCADEKKALDPAVSDELLCKRLLITYQSEQDRLRREEQQRREAEARRQEEARRAAEAEALAKEADVRDDDALLELALDLLAEPVVTPTIPQVAPTVPTVSGISTREVWNFRIVDKVKVPEVYKKVDEVAIRAVVRGMKGATQIPGVEVWAEKGIAAGGR